MFGSLDAVLRISVRHRRAAMKISSADVKSLLMRLHGEIQAGTEKVSTNRGSFAQSLRDCLGSVVLAETKSTEGEKPATGATTDATAAQEQETALPQARAELPLVDGISSEKPGGTGPVGRPTAQTPFEAKDVTVEVIALPEARGAEVKTASVPSAFSSKQKDKAEKSNVRKEPKRFDGSAEASQDILPGQKVATVDPLQQVANTHQIATEVSSGNWLAQTDNPSGAQTNKELPVASQIVKAPANSQSPSLTEPMVKKVIDSQESVKSKKNIVENTAKADPNEDKSFVAEEPSAPSSASDAQIAHIDKSLPHTFPDSSAVSASIALQQPATNDVPAWSQGSPPANVMHIVQPPNGTIEPRHAQATDHRILVATASAIEVGVTSGSHGWLKIRTELTDTGAIKAVLSSTSSTGQEMLHRELASLSSFLEQERIPVSSLAVHQEPSSGFDAGTSSGGGAADQQQARGENAGSLDEPQSLGLLKEMAVSDGLLDVCQGDLATSRRTGGGWLNVRA
jgi:hypothetical protein